MNREELLLECEQKLQSLADGNANPKEVSVWAYQKSQESEVNKLIEGDDLAENIFDKLLLAATPAGMKDEFVYGQDDFKEWLDSYLVLKNKD
jgi:hypothetical protein|tara:strand:+ start:1434 stop:1709 length:276 start_codon:yes stop_codon:yes gene_type:complete